MIVPRTIEGLKQAYPDASEDRLQRYIDLRNEGYEAYAAALMAGLRDPDDYDAKDNK